MKVLWLTNFDAPYRRPVWRAIAKHVELTIGLTDDHRSDDGRVRGSDWFDDRSRDYHVRGMGHDPRRGATRIALGSSALRESLINSDAVVLGGWEAVIYWQAAIQARRAGVRRVGFYESTPQSHRFRSGPIAAARARYMRALDAVVVPGESASRALRDMGVDPQRIYRGFNAVDVEAIADEASRTRTRVNDALGHHYLYLGQLIPRKNVAALIESFLRIARVDDRLTIAGEGEQREHLLGVAAGDARVRFVGTCSYEEVPRLLAHHHTLVLPSLAEVWGLVVNEALAAGLHVVVSDRCGVAADVVAMDGVTVCDVHPDALDSALRRTRAAWVGPIENPEILEYTPEAFAAVFLDALIPREIVGMRNLGNET